VAQRKRKWPSPYCSQLADFTGKFRIKIALSPM
jgi:hypothetical protein